jgi:hypothetical protein
LFFHFSLVYRSKIEQKKGAVGYTAPLKNYDNKLSGTNVGKGVAPTTVGEILTGACKVVEIGKNFL